MDFTGQSIQCQYFSNPDFVSDHKIVKEPLRLAINGGILTTYNKAKVPGFDEI